MTAAGHDHDHHDHDSDHHDHGHDHGHAGHDAHGHGHGGHGHHHDLRALGQRALWIALALNGAFLVVEAGVGWWSGSLALLSDAVHMLTDVAALVVAAVAAGARSRPASAVATFGHGRVAVLGGGVNALLSFGAAVVIVREAVERLQHPPTVPGLPVLVTATLGLFVNLASAWWLHASGDKGVNMRGALIHMLGDALGSVAAIVAGAVLFFGGPVYVDAVASIVVAAIVAGASVPLLRDVGNILLERAPAGVDKARLQALLQKREEIKDVTGFHAWCLDDGETVASFVFATNEADLHKLAHVADEVREEIEQTFGIVHATIEWRPLDHARDCCHDPASEAQRHEHSHEPPRHQPAA